MDAGDQTALMTDRRLTSPLELREVERHRYLLCERQGEEVSFERAFDDWLCHHAADWRARAQRELLERQRREIEKHKWIESEKARRDLGNDAVFDWIRKYAARWREQFERHPETGGL